MANRELQEGWNRLPTECRVKVYEHLFKGARLNITCIDQSIPSSTNPEDLKTHTFGSSRQFLLSCRTVFKEALPYLSKATALYIYEHFDQQVPLRELPDLYLSKIETLHVEIETFINLNLTCLPALRRVTLMHVVFPHPEEESIYPLFYDMLQFPNNRLLRMAMRGIKDWPGKRPEALLFAKRHGLKLSHLLIKCYGRTDESQHMEMLIDIEKEKEVIKWKRCYENGKEITSEEARKREAATQDL